MATTRHIIPLGLKYATIPGRGPRIELPLPDGTPLVVYFDSLDELGVYLAQSPLHWQDAAHVLALVKQFMREDYEQGESQGWPHALEACETERSRECDQRRAAKDSNYSSTLFNLNPWVWGMVIGAVLTYLTATFFIGD